MTLFQILMFAASAFFAFRIYQHIQTLKDLETKDTPEYSSSFDPKILIERADEAYEEGDLKKSLELLSEANAKERNNPDTIFKIGYILQKQGSTSEALDYYNQALEIDRDNEYIHNAIASIYRENREFASAKMHLNESLEINGKNKVTYYNYGNLLVDMKHFEEAKQMYKKALEIDHDFSEAKEELDKMEAKTTDENSTNL
ncbi:MAG: hypothetical protein QG559_129 [Campylobacterota bacterium]|nr:hypothetical protein [Campylobacterota bacterium]